MDNQAFESKHQNHFNNVPTTVQHELKSHLNIGVFPIDVGNNINGINQFPKDEPLGCFEQIWRYWPQSQSILPGTYFLALATENVLLFIYFRI